MFRVLSFFMVVCLFELCRGECENFKKCGECLGQLDCIWCRKLTDNLRPAGCMSRDESTKSCIESFIEDEQLRFKFIKNDPLKVGSAESRVLLTPQIVHLSNAREGHAYNVTLKFQQTTDYPVDFYFLTDASNTMESLIRNDLVNIATTLSKKLYSLTKEVKFGFGTFVDKDIPPFSFKNQNPYSFRNVLELTDDLVRFKEAVNGINATSNFDAPESALDAVLQAVVCVDDLQWRKDARKIIFVTTDAPTHVAGNGKVGGITKPNDGQCHLANGYYTEALKQDYASYGLLARKIKEHSKNVIFAVNFSTTYLPLAKFAKGSVSVTKLDPKSLNLVRLVEDQYRAIASSVQLVHNSSEFVKLTYYSSCLDENEVERSECENLQIDKEVNFTIGIQIVKCPSKKVDQRQTLIVKAYGYQDTLTLDIDFNCYCPCEKADNETCPTRCNEYKLCVECDLRFRETNSYHDNDCGKCNGLATYVQESEPFEVLRASERRCMPIKDFHTGCETDFAYGYDDELKQIVVRYIDNQRCPAPFPLATTSFALMGGIVVVGIALMLIWRCLLYLYDKKEYARFLEESKKAQWSPGANPLYVGVSTTVQNPAFKSSHDEFS